MRDSRLQLRVSQPLGIGKPDARVVALKLEAVQGVGTHRGRPLRAYRVHTTETTLGVVREATETLERRTRGRTYVNARWTGSRTVWHAEGDHHRRTCRTRAEAIARMLGYGRGERA